MFLHNGWLGKMKDGFDINQIKDDGYLIIPISMAKISTSQAPKEVYKILKHFSKKLITLSNDVIIMYTGGLYFNNPNLTYKDRKKMNQQIIEHATAFKKIVHKKKEYMPNAFHYLPIDYIILNSQEYQKSHNL